MPAYSLLDLCPLLQGQPAALTFEHSKALAQAAEEHGYTRYWLAEHHNMSSIGSSATSVVMGHVAAATRSIRIGSGGVMLPNHAPLVIAEQFGTLEALYPGRIDLGVGRAPGTDPMTSRALRRSLNASVDDFPRDVAELLAYLGDPLEGQKVFAVPGQGSHVPVWILGSSTFGASLAANFGLPYAFASHFAPAELLSAIRIYRDQFKPSAYLQQPYVMAAMNVIAAESDDQAQFLSSSMKRTFINLRRGRMTAVAPPEVTFDSTLHAADKAMLDEVYRYAAIGGRETVREALQSFIALTRADEIMISGYTYDIDYRLASVQITAEILNELS